MSLDFSNEKIGAHRWGIDCRGEVVLAWRTGNDTVHVSDVRGNCYTVGLDGKIGTQSYVDAFAPPECVSSDWKPPVTQVPNIKPTDLFVLTETFVESDQRVKDMYVWEKDTIVSGEQVLACRVNGLHDCIRKLPYRPFSGKKEFLALAHEFFQGRDGDMAYAVSRVDDNGFVLDGTTYTWLEAACFLRFARTGQLCAVLTGPTNLV